MKRLVLILYSSLLAFVGNTQELDSLILLPEFEKTEIKFYQTKGLSSYSTIDSTFLSFGLNNSFADILQASSTLLIRNYGPGYSVSASQRGLASAHTPIYWQGINLNSPTTGIGDLSLVPSSFIQSLAISNSGVSAALGSGMVAGGIHLNQNYQNEKERITSIIGFNINSNQNYESTASIHLVKKGWRFNTNLVYDYSLNRFQYVNAASKQDFIETREHSEFVQKGILQNIQKYFGNHHIQLDFWGVQTDRNLAPSLTSSYNNEQQEDLNIKVIITDNVKIDKTHIQLKTGWLYDQLFYKNGSGVNSSVYANQLILNADFTHHFKKSTTFVFGSDNSLQSANAQSNYQEVSEQIAASFYAGAKQTLFKNRLQLDFLFRKNIYKDYKNPFSPAIGANYQVFKWMSVKAGIARNFRIPGFNDRYWFPGGKADLNPEDSWLIELGPSLRLFQKSENTINISTSAFYQIVDNWIQWIPGVDNWQVVNYKSVESRGYQLNIAQVLSIGELKVKSNLSYVFSKVENISSSFSADISETPIVHAPNHKGSFTSTIQWQNFNFLVDGNYTGTRYASSNISDELAAIYLMNIGAGYLIPLKLVNLDIKLKVHNLLNIEYQVMPYMPMPLRNYSLGLKINFKSKI